MKPAPITAPATHANTIITVNRPKIKIYKEKQALPLEFYLTS